MAVIRVPRVNQWAEITTTAFGWGIRAAASIHASLNSFTSIPFMGEPCPIKSTGITSVAASPPVNSLNCRNVSIFPLLRYTKVYFPHDSALDIG
ncbi:hypothetical protein D9M68_795950 [compost metagenome]